MCSNLEQFLIILFFLFKRNVIQSLKKQIIIKFFFFLIRDGYIIHSIKMISNVNVIEIYYIYVNAFLFTFVFTTFFKNSKIF